MFFGLSMKEKLETFPETIIVPEGKTFYRARSADKIKDAQDPKEWALPPAECAKAGRFNAAGESVLYVSTASYYLEREIKLEENEEYYLAEYVCKKKFKVGSFLDTYNRVNSLLHKIAISVAEPDDFTEKELKLIDEHFECAKENSLIDLLVDMVAGLYIYRLIPNLYKTTNKLGKLVLKKNDNGFRYSSVYEPIELSGAPQIVTLNGMEHGNYVLTQKGYENLELVAVEKKIAAKPIELDLFIKEFSKIEKRER